MYIYRYVNIYICSLCLCVCVCVPTVACLLGGREEKFVFLCVCVSSCVYVYPQLRVSSVDVKERECCLLVLNLVSSTLPCVESSSVDVKGSSWLKHGALIAM